MQSGNVKPVRAIVFDYGNTLVEFGKTQIAMCDKALIDGLQKLYGRVDREGVRRIRDKNRMAPYAGDPPMYRENDLQEITADLVRELYGVEPSREEMAEILRGRLEVFVQTVEISEAVRSLLARLAGRYPLGLLSNYPDGHAIRASLEKERIGSFFASVVVSADIGFIKPHPLPFSATVSKLAVPPEAILFVGDNWLADIQGGKRAGMRVAHTIQWSPYEHFDHQPGEFEPDFVLQDLMELERYV